MRDPVEFLTAHLDEDEEAAREAVLRPWFSTDNFLDDANGGDVARFEIAADARHAGRHDPARVLAEVEAKRQIIEEIDQLKAEVKRLRSALIDAQGYKDEVDQLRKQRAEQTDEIRHLRGINVQLRTGLISGTGQPRLSE